MTSYNKNYLDTLAKEKGFIRDNLEKVLRLVKILGFIHENEHLAKSLVLKGGTAINLTIFEMPRLSVDIDLDCNINYSREEMLAQRAVINDEMKRYMLSEGYTLKPASKSPLSLDSWVFGYTNAGGNPDNIKIEINYSDRCHVLPCIERHVSIDFLGDIVVNVLDPLELYASKINALVNRAAMRDLYDVHNMLTSNLFATPEERTMLRKIFVFYHAVGAQSKAEDVSLQSFSLRKIEMATYAAVKSQLVPVLRKSEKFDFAQTKNEVLSFLQEFLTFDETEMSFVQHFNRREYCPALLFGETEIADRVAGHPMALWKCRPKD